ncbi:MAG: hypothetical protein ABUL60_15230 [Myxococcales bacterium]
MSRLGSELASASYSARLEVSDEPLACQRAPFEGHIRVAWVSLTLDPENRDLVRATLCFDGATVVMIGPRSDPARFAVTTAEALNGLAAAPKSTAQRPSPPATTVQAPSPESVLPPPLRDRHALSLVETLIADPGGFPVLWGSAVDAELSLGRHFALMVEGFFPISRAELLNADAELRAGLAFMRLGPALRYSMGELTLSGSLVVGPAFTWVTARATPPYVGGTDSAVSAFGAAGVQALYPEQSPIFALALVRASLLLPAARFALPQAPPRSLGPALFEASLGVGLRL